MKTTLLIMMAVLGLMTGCGTGGDDEGGAATSASTTTTTAKTATTDRQVAAETTHAPVSTTTTDEGEVMEQRIVRFSSGDAHVDVTITEDNPTARDFLSMLPLALTLEEFAGREKIGYLPRELETAGSPGHDPDDGDLIYFAPWGNLGSYYNTEGIGHDDRVIHLGTYDATLEQLTNLEGDVTVAAVR
jgi:hypothetical protein